jgi:hypothetical protein
VLECGTTAEQRRECKNTYRECLQYVALAVLLGDRIGLPNNMPEVGSDHPGRDLSSFLGKDLVLPIGDNSPNSDLLTRAPIFEARVIDWLKLLDEAFSLRKSVWEDLIVREVSADYLGKDKSLTSHEVQPSDLRLHARHYTPSLAIQEAIPMTFVTKLRGIFKAKFRRLNVTDENIDEFISRMAVTHVVNYWKMNRDIEAEHAGAFIRLPHMTRSSIRFVELSQSEHRPADDSLRQNKRDQIMRALLPYPLRQLLHGLTKRQGLIQRLLDLRDAEPFPKLRDRLKKALGELEQGDYHGVAKLCGEIETLSRSEMTSGAEPTSLTFGVRLESESATPYVDLPLPKELWNKWFRPDRYCLRQLTSISEKSAERDIKRVFKEIS